MSNLAFNLYLLFVVSHFLHLPKRLPLLGAIHLDLLLQVFILALIAAGAGRSEVWHLTITKRLGLLFTYVVLSLPLVRWPGTAIRVGIPMFVEVAVFFVFTIALLDTEVKYRRFLYLFVACQSVRVLEPLYLHVTTGYWGSMTNMGGEAMSRLSGSPYDIVNPNGLAFIIATLLPFYFFLAKSVGRVTKCILLALIPVSIYALVLTASRTGILALMVIVSGVILKSRRKMIMFGLAVIAFLFVSVKLSDLQSDRFRSIYDRSARGSATAQGRIAGVIGNLRAFAERPVFGHGLGTSVETNANVLGSPIVAHNLYAEILQEIGLIGLAIFFLYITSLVKNVRHAVRTSKESLVDRQFLRTSADALEVWLWMNVLFSLASYGLSRYEWYLLGGLSASLLALLASPAASPAPIRQEGF